MSGILQRKLREALGNLQAGNVSGAERLCRDVLSRAPRNPQALHLLGAARLAAGDPGQAAEHIMRALETDAQNPAMLEHLGLAHLSLKQYGAAETSFRRALSAGASHAALHMRLGLALLSQQRVADALVALRTARDLAPGDADVLLNLGNALAAHGEAEAAMACYRQVLASHPGNAHAHFNSGAQWLRMGRLAEARAEFQAALDADPRYADAHQGLGAAFQQEHKLDDAAGCYRKAIAVEPRHIAARNNLGNVLAAQGRVDEAESCYENVIKTDPEQPDAYLNLGNVRAHQRRFREAQLLYEKVVELDPSSYDAHYNLGDAWWGQGHMDEAEACYARSLQYRPGFAAAQYNLGLIRLFRQDFGAGWAGYERRLESPSVRRAVRKEEESLALFEGLPRWQGPAEEGMSDVAIWAEQGIGDQLLFSTLIPDLIELGQPFVCEVDRRLLAAYERAFSGQRFVAMSDPPRPELRQASRAILAGSLPSLLRRTRASFSRQPRKLLAAHPERVEFYRNRFAASVPECSIAVSWRSTNQDWLGPNKSSTLAAFAPLLQLGGQWVDVQYGDTRAERHALEASAAARLLHVDEVDYYRDLEEMLAIIEACDLVITTSNVNAHLAGVLGKRTWLLYPADRAPFHYWAHDGAYRSLWYPSVEIVTAPHLADWPSLISHAASKLRAEGLSRS